ncbi:hypothetical protein I3760_15G019700 [Carya illinoinensis]|nr:hypothetical protein I3760_15G019700 [Carya illinoinensis]
MGLLALIVIIMLLTFSDSAALANSKLFGRRPDPTKKLGPRPGGGYCHDLYTGCP